MLNSFIIIIYYQFHYKTDFIITIIISFNSAHFSLYIFFTQLVIFILEIFYVLWDFYIVASPRFVYSCSERITFWRAFMLKNSANVARASSMAKLYIWGSFVKWASLKDAASFPSTYKIWTYKEAC